MGLQPGVRRWVPMDEGTLRLGQRLQLARETRRPKLSQPEAAQQLGVGRTTIQNIEAGKFAKINASVRQYAALLGVSDAEVDRVYAGEPEPEAQPEQPDAGRLPLPAAVEFELRSSETLEANVITLGPDEDDGHFIVVLQAPKGATPEQQAKIAARFRKARRLLQALPSDDEVAES